MIGFLIALISGALMSVQGVFNTKVTEASSMWAANAFVQFTAFLVCIVAWLFADRTSFREVLAVEPKYFFARRGDGRIYHVDSHQEHGCFGTGKGGDADRDSTVDHCVLDRALWHVRRGEAAF